MARLMIRGLFAVHVRSQSCLYLRVSLHVVDSRFVLFFLLSSLFFSLNRLYFLANDLLRGFREGGIFVYFRDDRFYASSVVVGVGLIHHFINGFGVNRLGFVFVVRRVCNVQRFRLAIFGITHFVKKGFRSSEQRSLGASVRRVVQDVVAVCGEVVREGAIAHRYHDGFLDGRLLLFSANFVICAGHVIFR